MAAGSRTNGSPNSGPPPIAALAEASASSPDFIKSLPFRTIEIDTGNDRDKRRLSIYEPIAVFGLVDELRFLSQRAIEKNVFFDPKFLAPALPRLDDRNVNLMVVHDEDEARSRLRLLMPFSVERTSWRRRSATIRAWTHPFGPNGTLLLDGDDPDETLASFLSALRRPELGLPDVLVLPDLRIDGPLTAHLLRVAETAGLSTATVNAYDRAAILKNPQEDPAPFPRLALSRRRLRELARQRRLLERCGPVTVEVARDADAIRLGLESFLALEASGWKGRTRSALIMDRYRAAFAREAVNALGEDGRVQIFTLKVGAQPVAALIAFVDGGEAYSWKTAYDERFSRASPGQQIVAEATRRLLADPSVRRMDSCTVPDHFVMNRFWKDRIAIGTLVIGLRPGLREKVDATARSLAARHRSSNLIRIVRERVKSLMPGN